MNVPIELLESLIAVADNLSMKDAAQQLKISQPALSMQLKRLEEAFAAPLFEFQGKKKILTSFGISVYKEAKRIRNEINSSFENINRRHLNADKLTLRIGGRRELLLRAKKAIRFDGKIELHAMSSDKSLRALNDREIDIAISRIKPNSSEQVAMEFFENCPWLVTHKKWAKNKSLSNLSYDLDFIKNTPFISYSKQSLLGRDWLTHLGLSDEQLNIKYVCEDWLSVLQMIESGDGYSIIPDSIESNLDDVVHVELPCSVVKPETYFFIYNKSLTKLPAYKNIFKK